MSSAVYLHHLTVPPEDIDALGHVNNLAYLRWTQATATAVSTSLGWSTDRHLQMGSGWIVRSHQIKYLRPAFLHEEIRVRTWIVTLDGATSLRRYRIERPADERLLALAQTMWVYVDFKTGIPKRVPTEVARCYTPLPGEGDGEFRFDD